MSELHGEICCVLCAACDTELLGLYLLLRGYMGSVRLKGEPVKYLAGLVAA